MQAECSAKLMYALSETGMLQHHVVHITEVKQNGSSQSLEGLQDVASCLIADPGHRFCGIFRERAVSWNVFLLTIGAYECPARLD